MYIPKKLRQIVRREKINIAYMAGWTTLTVLADALRMVNFGLLMVALLLGKAANQLVLFTCLAVLFTVLQRVSEHTAVHKRDAYGNQFKKQFRKELFEKLFSLGPAFMDHKRTGELVSTLREKVSWINFYLFYYLPTSGTIFIFSLLCALCYVTIHPITSFIVILGGILTIVVPPLFHRFIKGSTEEEWDENDAFYSSCLDGLQGIVTLKAFNANRIHRKKIEALSEDNRKKIMKNLIRTTLNNQVMVFIISASEIALTITGAYLYSHEIVNIYQMILLFMAAASWAEGAKRIQGAWLRGNRGIAAFENAWEIISSEASDSMTNIHAKSCPSSSLDHGDIHFDQVTFSYKQSFRPAVDNMTITMKAGTSTAFVGYSGSGKSTVARLLFGFYKPQQGRIAIGDVALDSNTVYAFQNKITAIWQDSHIFHDTCMENIRIACQSATDEEVFTAAKKANIHEMILGLPDGYQTIIGDGGREISGGEAQRIAIARTFLRNTQILILDEATSSLDRKNEMEIQQSLRLLGEGKTVIAIAHRLDTIRDSDQICVMDHGRIVEQGTHEQLMLTGAHYQILMGAANGKGAMDHV